MKRVVLIFFSILSISSIAISQWSTDPYNNLIVGYGLLPELCSDGAGGCYITYEQGTTYPRHLLLERLNRYGYKPWESGKQINGEFEEQSSAKIVEDGEHGVIITYLDIERLANDYFIRLKVQRIDSSGNFLWDTNGVRISLSETNQYDHNAVSDGQGGCIVAWVDTLGDLRINRIDSTGIRVWGDSGRYVWNSPVSPPMISDNQNGCYLLYGIGRLQHFDNTGNTIWAFPGISIPTGAITMSLDSAKNIYLFGSNFLGYNGQTNVWTVNLQKVKSDGMLEWDSLGIILDTIYTSGYLNHTTSYNGTSFLTWDDEILSIRKVYYQIVSCIGQTVKPIPFEVTSCSVQEWTPHILLSEDKYGIIIWRNYDSVPSLIYSQKVDTSGNKIWNINNIVVSVPALSYEKTITDYNGGFIIAGSGDDFSIRVQQVSKYGRLGEIITDVNEREITELPTDYLLYQNFPNPFNSSTIIKYDIPRSSHVKLGIYNLLGQKLFTLVDQYQQPGTYQINFGPSNLPSGVYLLKLQTPNSIMVKKLLILK
jgi:hypothetical protein